MPRQHGRQLPGEVVRRVDRGVHAGAARRRGAVRRVADQEHVAVAESLRDFGPDPDQLTAQDLDCEVGPPGRTPNEAQEVVGAQPADRLHIAAPRCRENPPLPIPARRHHDARRRTAKTLQHVQSAQIAPDDRRHIGAEEDAEVLADPLDAAGRDAEPPADGTVGAVRGDDVPRLDLDALAGLAVDDDRANAVVRLLQVGQLRVEADVRGGVAASMLEQDRLEDVLRERGGSRRAQSQRLIAIRVAERSALELRCAEVGADGADELDRHGSVADSPLDTPLAEQLHGTGADAGGLGVNRGRRVPLDEQRPDSEAGQKDRAAQSGRAGADDQNWDLHEYIPQSFQELDRCRLRMAR